MLKVLKIILCLISVNCFAIEPIWVKINPQGTWLWTDTSVGMIFHTPVHTTLSDGTIIFKTVTTNKPDIRVPPSSLDLKALMENKNIQLEAGDILTLEMVGGFGPGGNVPDSNALLGAFSGPEGLIAPGRVSSVASAISLTTCSMGFPTDVPNDFYIPSEREAHVQVPAGATKLLFSANSCYFRDNTDLNFDFGVFVKITLSPLKFKKIIVDESNPDVSRMIPSLIKDKVIIKGKVCIAKDNLSLKKFKLLCKTRGGIASDKCKVRFNLESGEKKGGHTIGHDDSTRPLGKLHSLGITPGGELTEADQVTYYPIPEDGLVVTYIAPDVSGDVILDFEVKDENNVSINSIPTTISVRAPVNYSKIAIEGLIMDIETHRGDGDFATIESIWKFQNLVREYRRSAEILGVPDENDIIPLESEGASLSWGGLFDINKKWTKPHCGHRDGRTLDLSLSIFNNSKYKEQLRGALAAAVREGRFNVYKSESPDNPETDHWHISW